MKKKIFATTGALAIAGVIGLSVYQSNAEPTEPKFATEAVNELTESTEANNQVIEANLSNQEARELALNEHQGIVTEFEVEQRRGNIVYEIDIKNEDMKYELKIDGNTGEILKSTEEREHHSKIAEMMENPGDFISMLEAEEIALNEFQGVIKGVELDSDDGRLVYELELKNDREEADFEIDARTGEIIEQEIEFDD